MSTDTIVAIATAPGRGAIGVVRASGPAVQAIMQAVCGRALTPRIATHLSFLDSQGQPVDDGLAIFFQGPNSYTGEDVLELQGHGGPGVMALVLQQCLAVRGDERGSVIRIANPGEFTQRAFLNDKLDLAQAESVADLIDAGSERAAKSALASLQGRFSGLVQALLEKLIDLRMRVEACLDFPEEDIEFIAREGVQEKLQAINHLLDELRQSASRGAALRDGLRVVLVGAPNVGKSSLLNALAEQDVALVTEIAGTTRDRIVQEITIDGVPMHVIDTAGLRATQDVVELLGIERTWREIEQAQVVLLLRDASGAIATDAELEGQVLARVASARSVIRVLNKSDLSAAGIAPTGDEEAIAISAKTGAGLDRLRARLLELAGWSGDASAGVFSARARHLDALSRARAQIDEAEQHLHDQELELLAECLRQAQSALSEITGEFSSDDLLGEIFGRFCIGK
ncbi:MAG: tRNA uridine-5-carboxymethylaminomethyl(34) synthesis GTPase MnmE [Burkholderiaceae bacterium]|nr:tRNA uridine-5-carboxymethylaminomethyl(34) synthesis GTPase MnmE [Burkholderiaceae bacterium]